MPFSSGFEYAIRIRLVSSQKAIVCLLCACFQVSNAAQSSQWETALTILG
jgi:hypothetical protein